MERSYIAFISYKHAERDSAIAKNVHSLIENYIVPKSLRKDGKKLGIVFRDEEELPISHDLTESICTALDASRYLIVICSPEAKESPWVAREVEYFLRHHDARDAFVVLANGEPNEVFPYALTHVINKETGESQEVEPLAMDARADTTAEAVRKIRSNIKKLYAAMLGCSYDSLVQREKTRRMKRIVALVSLGVLVASCFAGVLFVKNQELSHKNDQLTAAISLALERESQLLADEADEALQNGDMTTALQYASEALDSTEIDRPYHAPAERVLFSALDVLEEYPDQTVLSKVPLKHAAPVEMMAYSADGSTVYTMDIYGTVSAFDASTGEVIFSIKLRDNTDSFLTVLNPQMKYNAESNRLICHYRGVISALDAATGETIWEFEQPNKIDNGIFLDPEGRKIAFIERIYQLSDELLSMACDYNFIVLSAEDGSLLHKIALPSSSSTGFVEFPVNQCDWASGDFADSNRFVGTLFQKEEEIARSLLYVVDLEQNSVRYIDNEILTKDSDRYDYMRTFDVDRDHALVISSAGDLRMRYFDLEAGSLLWESVADMDIYLSANTPCYVLHSAEICLVAAGKTMHAVSNENGEILASTMLYDEIIDLFPLKDGMFGFALENGYCAAGWINSYGLHDSKTYNAVVDLPNTPQIVMYNGGLVQQHYTDNQIDGFRVLPVREGGGSACYLSEDKCTAYVTSALPSAKIPAPVEVKMLETVYNPGYFSDAASDGRVLLSNASRDGRYGVSIVDTENNTCTYILLDEDIARTWDSYFLDRNGEYIIANRDNGFVYRIAMDGSAEVLAENYTVTLATSGDTSYVAQLYKADSARQSADGRLITARCTGKELNLWTDGTDGTVQEIPGDVRWAVVDGTSIRSIFHAGENGLLVLSDFLSKDSVQIENFAVYDLSTQKWKLIADAAGGSAERLIAFGENSKQFAVYDADMFIRIYDWNAAEPVHCISTNLPLVSVVKMGMLMEDQYVYILTKDGQFMIYSMETGELVSRTVFTGVIQEESFKLWPDPANNRLYLGMENESLCLDVRSWEVLLRYTGLDDFKFFVADQNAVYMSRYDSETSSANLRAVPIPRTDAMIQIAQDVLR